MIASDVRVRGADASLARARWVLVAAGVIVGAAYAGILCHPAGGVVRFLDNVHWTVAYVAGATLAWIGVGAAEKEERAALRWFALGMSAYALGQVLWDVQVAVGWNPFPGPSDLFFLMLGPACARGLWATLRIKVDRAQTRTAALDIAMLAIGVLMLTLALYLPLRGDMGLLPLVVLIAYPVGLLTAASIGVVLVLTLRLGSDRRWLLFFAALVVNGGLWMEWNALTLSDKLEDGSLFNLMFSVTALAMGWGALQWRARPAVTPRWDRFCEGFLRVLPLGLVLCAAFTMVLVLTLPAVGYGMRVSVGLGAVVVAILAMVRQRLLLSERDRLLAAEQEVRENEELFSKAFWLSPDCLVISRLSDRVVLRANEALCRLWGGEPEQIIGKTGRDFVQWQSEDERRAFMRRLEESGECRNHETILSMADGRRLNFNISARLITQKGEPCVLVIMTDITERKRAEVMAAQMAAIVESSDDAIIGKNMDGIITSWNRGAEAVFGYKSEEATGKPVTMLMPDERKQEEFIIMERIWRGESVRHFETVRVRKDGRHIDVSVTISPIKDRAGRVVGASKVARDITEKKKADRVLLHERNFSGAVIDSLPGILYLYDRDGKFIRWNKNFERVSGYTADEITGLHPLDFFEKEDKKWIETRIAEVFVNGQSDAEADFVSKDGTKTPYYFTGRQITLDGKVCLVGVGIDLTARRESEREVRLLAERLKYATDAARIGVWDWNIKANTWYVTPMYFTMLGLDPGEGFSLHETWIDRLHPEDRPAVEAKLKALLSGVDAAYSYQARMALSDGSYNWFRVVGRVLAADENGRPTRLIGVRMDISESKRAEEEIRELNSGLERRVVERTAELEAANADLEQSRATFVNLFESLPGLYLVLTPDLIIAAVNNAYMKATKTTREGIIGRGLFEAFPDNPDDTTATGVSNLRASLDRVRQSGEPDIMAIQKYDVRSQDGRFEERYWSPINSPVFGLNRRLEYIIHRVEDVTDFVKQKPRVADQTDVLKLQMERMEAEIFLSSQKVQAANQQLQAANKELEAFSYSVSHDLRAPLRTVDGFSQAVLEDYGEQLPGEGRRYLQTIRKGAQQMGELIDDLLKFARLSRATMEVVCVDMNRLVRTALSDLHFKSNDPHVELRWGELPACAGDAALLRQVWVNLLSNALKYTGRREKAVIEIGSRVEGGETIYFVKDNGAGFDMRYADKLFGVFQRLHRAEDYEGTGVGLAIVQRIVHRHGGRIWAEAEEDRGAVFYFTVEERKIS